MTGAIAQDRESCQFLFCFLKTHRCTGRLGRGAIGRCAKGSLSRRSLKLRASGAVGLRWQAVFGSSDCLESIDSTRRRTRRGAGWQAQMAEDLDDYRLIFDACPERVEGAAMIFKAPPQVGQCSMSMSKTRLRAGPS